MSKVFKISLLTLLSVSVLSIVVDDVFARRRSNSRENVRSVIPAPQVLAPIPTQTTIPSYTTNTVDDSRAASTNSRLEAAASLLRDVETSTSASSTSSNIYNAANPINSAADSYKKSLEIRKLTSCMSNFCEQDGHFYGACFNTSNALNLIEVYCQDVMEQSANSSRLTFDFLSKMNNEFETACREVSNNTSFGISPSGDYSQSVYLYKKSSISNGSEMVVSYNEEMTQNQCSEMANGSYIANKSCPRTFCTDSQGATSNCSNTSNGFKYELLSDYVSTSARCPVEIGFGPLQNNGSYKSMSVNVGSPVFCTRDSFGVSEKEMTFKIKLKDDPAALAAVVDGSIKVALEGTFGIVNTVKAKKEGRAADAFVSGKACMVKGVINSAESCNLNDGSWDGTSCYKINRKGNAKKTKIRKGELAKIDCPENQWVDDSLDQKQELARKAYSSANEAALNKKGQLNTAYMKKGLTMSALNTIDFDKIASSNNDEDKTLTQKERIQNQINANVEGRLTAVDIYGEIDQEYNTALSGYSSAVSDVKYAKMQGAMLDERLDGMEERQDLYKASANQNMNNALAGASQIVQGVMDNKNNKHLVLGKCFIMVNGQPSMIIAEEGGRNGRTKIEYNSR